MLLDTSGLVCAFDSRESHHVDAVTYFDAASFRLVHSYILCELVALMQARGLARVTSLTFVGDLLDSPDIEVIWVDSALHRAALALLQARLDKTYSLCDAVSFVLMREGGVTDALTTDHHFEQEGFVRLLR